MASFATCLNTKHNKEHKKCKYLSLGQTNHEAKSKVFMSATIA